MFQDFFNKIETLFDESDHFSEKELTFNKYFQTEDNAKLLENIQIEQTPQSVEIFFSRLAPFFELGFLLRTDEAQSVIIQKIFCYGELNEKIYSTQIKELPPGKLENIYISKNSHLLHQLGIQNSLNVKNLTCLIIRVTSHKCIILATHFANPWLQIRVEHLQNAIFQCDFTENHQI